MSVYGCSDFNPPLALSSLVHLAALLSEENLGVGKTQCLNWLREDTECTNLLLSLRGCNFFIHFPFKTFSPCGFMSKFQSTWKWGNHIPGPSQRECGLAAMLSRSRSYALFCPRSAYCIDLRLETETLQMVPFHASMGHVRDIQVMGGLSFSLSPWASWPLGLTQGPGWRYNPLEIWPLWLRLWESACSVSSSLYLSDRPKTPLASRLVLIGFRF